VKEGQITGRNGEATVCLLKVQVTGGLRRRGFVLVHEKWSAGHCCLTEHIASGTQGVCAAGLLSVLEAA
jgi:hypothetical protein